MLNTNFTPWPSFSEEEADAVKNVLLSNKVNYWTGNECREFEKEFAVWSNSKYAIALGNGTLALDSAFKALDIGIGDEVIVTARTYIASVTSIVNAGAIPIFADVDLNSQNITPESIRSKITKKTKAIVCVHLAGWPCEMDGIMDLSNEFNLYVIEDCSQAHGASINNKSSGFYSDMSITSFYGSHIINCAGNGGALAINNDKVMERAKLLRSWGRSSSLFDEKSEKIENRFNSLIGFLTNDSYWKSSIFSEEIITLCFNIFSAQCFH